MKKFGKFLLILFVILLVSSIYVIYTGKKYYEDTINKVPIQAKVLEVRNDYTFVKASDVPDYYKNAIVAVEDHRFFSHGPVDYLGIMRAVKSNIVKNEFAEGGSTITQQVAKNLYYINSESPIKRKIAEIYTAIDLEANFTKDEILEIYFNKIYFGNGYYGIKEACNGYLNKEPKDMTLSEATMMAGIPNAPSVYAPNVNKELCKSRQKKVISDMVQYEYITQEEADEIDQSFIDNL